MTCKNCSKEYDVLVDYCPHCGVIAKPPSKAENRMKPKDLLSTIVVIHLFAVASVYGYLEMSHDDTLEAPVRSAFLTVIAVMAVVLIKAIPTLYYSFVGRKLPLIKRVAFVAAKRFERRSEGAPGRRGSYYTTFAFPDNTCLEFKGSEIYRDLVERDCVVVKYKRVGPFQEPVFYGYEHYNEPHAQDDGPTQAGGDPHDL